MAARCSRAWRPSLGYGRPTLTRRRPVPGRWSPSPGTRRQSGDTGRRVGRYLGVAHRLLAHPARAGRQTDGGGACRTRRSGCGHVGHVVCIGPCSPCGHRERSELSTTAPEAGTSDRWSGRLESVTDLHLVRAVTQVSRRIRDHLGASASLGSRGSLEFAMPLPLRSAAS